MTVDREVNAEVEVVDIEDSTPDPGALREAERRINDVARLAEVVDASINEADQAATAAQAAKSKSARMFQQKQAIEALQDAGVASSEVLVSLAESQKHLFENQQALSNLIRELTGYALGSIANTRGLVYAASAGGVVGRLCRRTQRTGGAGTPERHVGGQAPTRSGRSAGTHRPEAVGTPSSNSASSD